MMAIAELSSELRKYLKNCGLSERKIAQCNTHTRMYHDLGFYGDIAEGNLQDLIDEYHIDFSDFEFEKFFPVEFLGNNIFTRLLFQYIPFASYIARQRGEYLPFTLGMVEEAIRIKRWCPEGTNPHWYPATGSNSVGPR